jgi:hypothetical protein
MVDAGIFSKSEHNVEIFNIYATLMISKSNRSEGNWLEQCRKQLHYGIRESHVFSGIRVAQRLLFR